MGQKIVCKVCCSAKPFADYYESNLRTCKECVKQRVRRNRAAKVGYYRAYDAQRFKSDPKVIARHKRYQATPAGKAALRRSHLRTMERYPDRRTAHVLLGNALKAGRVAKPDTCEQCGRSPRKASHLHGHHDDYTKPLDVRWLCVTCHRALHAASTSISDNQGAYAP